MSNKKTKPGAPSPDEFNQLVALYNARRYPELETGANALIGRYPDSGFAWKLLGAALQMQGKNALTAFQKTAQLMPGDAEAYFNLGVVQKSLGQLDDAVNSYRRALQLNPAYAEAYGNLGNILKDLGQLDQAVVCYHSALKIKPGTADAHNNLGTALKDLGRFDEAVTSYRRAVALRPDYADAYYNLGNILKDMGQLDAAVANYRRALDIKQDFVDAHMNLGTSLKGLSQFDSAMASYRRVLEIIPDFAEAYGNIGSIQKDLGQIEDAIANYQHALNLKPDYSDARSSLLFIMNYTSRHTPSYRLTEARQYGQLASKNITTRFSSWLCTAKPERLKVGLVSGDLRNHPVGYFLESLLAQINPARIELVAYPTQPKEDELTSRIRPYFSGWQPLTGKSDEYASHLIHDDGVHILLDLSGHTALNRLPIFARKPAPVQASWMGYLATTGMHEIDYVIADHVGVPESQRILFTETVWFLPDSLLCFSPPKTDLSVKQLPAQTNGHITFGCFQNMAKVGDEVLSAWSAILTALPEAQLRWQCHQFNDPTVLKNLTQRLLKFGINPARVSLHGSIARESYLATLSEVDLILDTFPYSGCTTTCEALWMGVPTLTLAGDTLLSRQGASLLSAAGLADWVTTRRDDYIYKAIAFSSDLPKLALLRSSLRKQVLASPLFDAPRFARNLEDALWGMWETHDKPSTP